MTCCSASAGPQAACCCCLQLFHCRWLCFTATCNRPPTLTPASERDPRDPAPEFVWNSWLRQPLLELGLYDHCPALLQVGACGCGTGRGAHALPDMDRIRFGLLRCLLSAIALWMAPCSCCLF